MSTRGTIAFIFYNETDGRYYLETSQQFQCDMAPGMNNGSCLLDCFDEFYFGKRKRCKASMKPFKLIEKFAKKINVDLDVIPYEWHMLRTKQDGTVVMDLRAPKKENGKPDYKNDFLTTALHYSDWIYIMPLCDVSTLQIIGETDDFASSPYTVHGLPRNELQIFHYRNLKYTYDGKNLTEYDVFGMGWPKDRKKFLNACREAPIRTLTPNADVSEDDGVYLDEFGTSVDKHGVPLDDIEDEHNREYREVPLDDTDPKELLDDIFDNPEFASEDEPEDSPFKKIASCKANPDGTIDKKEMDKCIKDLENYIDMEKNEKRKPKVRYEEIIVAYRDGDRDCLVVRTAGNKHVIFKEMK